MKATRAKWLDHYDELVGLIERTPEIVITRDALSFYDGAAKAAFHQSLRAMIHSLIDELLMTHEATADTRKSFRQVEASLCEKSGINGIELPRSLADYADDPSKTASKVLFETSLKLLQCRITSEELEQFAQDNVVAYWANLDRYLYEAWIAYGLLDTLDPVEFLEVSVESDNSFSSRRATRLMVGHQVPLKDFRLPEALFRTSSGDCYAYKFEHGTEIVSYKVPSRAKDFTAAGNTAGQVCHRVLLLYRIKDLEKVPIIAQRSEKSALQPDLMVEHLSSCEYSTLEKRQEVRSNAEHLDSLHPAQVILMHEQPEVQLEDSDRGPRAFQTHVIGHDRTLLAEVLAPLFTE